MSFGGEQFKDQSRQASNEYIMQQTACLRRNTKIAEMAACGVCYQDPIFFVNYIYLTS